MRFNARAKEIAKWIEDNDDFLIVGHNDADGISASGLIGQVLNRLGKQNEIKNLKQLNEDRINLLSNESRNLIFVDMGSGCVPRLENVLKADFAILDHHQPQGKRDKLHLNPHLFGIDGNKEISGAGVAYEVAKQFKFHDLSALAIIGAVGDMQDSVGMLVGHNRKILRDGIHAGVLEYTKDLRFFGRNSRPLAYLLSYSTDPFLSGLTGNEHACFSFLQDLGIESKRGDEWVHYVDLTKEEQKKIVSGLYVYGVEHGVPEHVLKNLVGEVYTLVNEKPRTELRDAKEFATLLNACGRNGRPEIGVQVCLGDRLEYYQQARVLLGEHRGNLRRGLEFVTQAGIKEMDHIYFFDAGSEIKDTLVGTIASMLYTSPLINPNKPILALADEEAGKKKISARATAKLVRRGLNLGVALRKACEVVGGEGGGHNIAAGARIEPSVVKEFLIEADRIIKSQLT
jgi:RecJ-like exonuclease